MVNSLLESRELLEFIDCGTIPRLTIPHVTLPNLHFSDQAVL